MPEPPQLPAPCERFHAIASLGLDTELPLLEAALHAAHARRCADCRAHAAEVAAITARIRASPAQQPSRRTPLGIVESRFARGWRVAVAGLLGALLALGAGGARVAAEPEPFAGSSGSAARVV